MFLLLLSVLKLHGISFCGSIRNGIEMGKYFINCFKNMNQGDFLVLTLIMYVSIKAAHNGSYVA